MNVKISDKISKDISTVYQAIVQKEHLCSYFTSDSTANLDAGERVIWEWKDAGAKCEVFKIETLANKTIGFEWSTGGEAKQVLIELNSITDSQTKITITESEFNNSDDDIKAMMGQTQGWTHFVCCLKAYLYANINLRE